jgi:glucosamine-6-phosphate deaminase
MDRQETTLTFNKVKCIVCTDSDAVAIKAASFISDIVKHKENPVIGLATGSTPLETYSKLVSLYISNQISFANTTTFNLDEYYGLPGEHDQSYRHFMNKNLFDKLDVKPWNTHVLNGTTRFPHLECSAYETSILAHGGVDIWLLGIGVNGHVAFNEPGSPVDSRTRVVALSQETITANSDGRFFKNASDVPRCALSCGIGTIREARQLVLIATGEKKAKAIAAALEGPFTDQCPASLLQDHPNCIFVIDKAAASQLKAHNNK